MSKLLQEALADAKAVKRIAIENAKVALEETFQREVTGMFQEKIKEELENEETYGVDKQSGGLQGSSDIGGTVGGSKKPSAKSHKTSTKVVPQPTEKFFEETEEVEETVTAEGGPHQTKLESETDEGSYDETITNEELEEILSSLEEELDEEGEPTATAPAPVDPNAPALPAPVDPNAPVAPAQTPMASAPVDPNADLTAMNAAPAQPPVAPAQPPVAEEEDMEEISLEELLSEIGSEEELDEAKEDKKDKEDKEDDDKEDDDKKPAFLKKENASLRAQLSEHIKVVEYLREQINEINLLNAKLLYTNKLFKQFGLSNSQKLSIVEKFDLASTVREVKYAYTILAESLNSGASTVKKANTVAKNITEGLASKAVASTKPSKDVIVENTNEMASRFQRLAGIKK